MEDFTSQQIWLLQLPSRRSKRMQGRFWSNGSYSNLSKSEMICFCSCCGRSARRLPSNMTSLFVASMVVYSVIGRARRIAVGTRCRVSIEPQRIRCKKASAPNLKTSDRSRSASSLKGSVVDPQAIYDDKEAG